ncbi:MAG: GH3 auxin-responsive promoter family protein [Thermaurantimonas sp.]|uniref:GH3 auxin-responsive promoter family protein n=1 Tax=Thermaurantimonas sp. TaxID=2681568 RepID=UPI00391B0871
MLKSIINNVLKWNLQARMDELDFFREFPEKAQRKILHELIDEARYTEYGVKYNFPKIESYEDFRRYVPVVQYETIEPYIARIKKGEHNVMWPGEISYFAKSSGTTNDRSKYIPVSQQALEECHFKAGRDMLGIYFSLFPESKLFHGLSLRIGGSTQFINEANGSYSGDLSAILIKNFPAWVQWRSTPSQDIALISDWEEKIEKIIDITIHEDVTSMAGVPSWLYVMAQRILAKTGAKHLHEIWPNMELYIHGGVSFTPYRHAFKKLFPGDFVHYLETYNASEGFFGIQDLKEPGSMLLMLDYGIFYELIPLDRLNDEWERHIIPVWEAIPGVNYALVISTNAGLWRYMPGDTVIFTETRPLRFYISGRTKHFINAFGEELMIENAERAIEAACVATGAEVRDFTAGPYYFGENTSGAHEWIIEFSKEPDDFKKFCTMLDTALREVNSDYDAKRFKDMTLKFPIIHRAPQHFFYNWLKSKNKLGGQNKVPKLKNDRSILDELLPLIS